MKKIILTIAVSLVLFTFFTGLHPGEDPLEAWEPFSRSGEARRLQEWFRCRIRREIAGEPCGIKYDIRVPAFYGRLGLFITLLNGRKVRGCFGAFDHRSDNAEAVLLEYLRGALRDDPRYPPLDASEIADTRVVLTVGGRPFPAGDINLLDISRFGVMIICGGRPLVFVPEEIRSRDFLIKKIESCGAWQASAFRALTVR